MKSTLRRVAWLIFLLAGSFKFAGNASADEQLKLLVRLGAIYGDYEESRAFTEACIVAFPKLAEEIREAFFRWELRNVKVGREIELKIYQVEWSSAKDVDKYIHNVGVMEKKLSDHKKWFRVDWLKEQRSVLEQACPNVRARLDGGAEDLEKRHAAELKALRALKVP